MVGYIQKIFPVMVGDYDAELESYKNFFASGGVPAENHTTVKSVEEKLRHHMDAQALGTPMFSERTVHSVIMEILACQGKIIEGKRDAAFDLVVGEIIKMVQSCKKE